MSCRPWSQTRVKCSFVERYEVALFEPLEIAAVMQVKHRTKKQRKDTNQKYAPICVSRSSYGGSKKKVEEGVGVCCIARRMSKTHARVKSDGTPKYSATDSSMGTFTEDGKNRYWMGGNGL